MTDTDRTDPGHDVSGAETGPQASGPEEGRALAEQALDHYAKGDEAGGDKLAEKAAKVDPAGAAEVVRDLDEDAASAGRG